MNFGRRFVGRTVGDRLEKAARAARELAIVPAAFANKVAAATGKLLTMGLYGVEATPVPKGKLASFRSAMVEVVDRK
eukprot:4196371-Alexandrium_andersonii.AAC.1